MAYRDDIASSPGEKNIEEARFQFVGDYFKALLASSDPFYALITEITEPEKPDEVPGSELPEILEASKRRVLKSWHTLDDALQRYRAQIKKMRFRLLLVQQVLLLCAVALFVGVIISNGLLPTTRDVGITVASLLASISVAILISILNLRISRGLTLRIERCFGVLRSLFLEIDKLLEMLNSPLERRRRGQ